MSATPRIFIDANILVHQRDARDADKQARAAEWMAQLWATRSGRLSLHVLHEYDVTVTQKLRPGLPIEEARNDVVSLQAWAPLALGLDLIEAAWRAQDRWGFTFWDSLIIAAAEAERCSVLLSEGFGHGQPLGTLTVMSPFLTAPVEVLPSAS